MDKLEKILTQIEVGLTWWCWKISILPFSRTFWKNKHEEHKKELKNKSH